MNESERELFERQLRRLPPAKLPNEFGERLAANPPGRAQPRPRSHSHTRAPRRTDALRWIRWLAPATLAAAALVVLMIQWNAPDSAKPNPSTGSSVPSALRADNVEIDRQLVSAFEAVATLPDGEPVRIRCREWMDEVVLHDSKSGVAIRQRTPRFEVIPVRLETY